MPRKSKPTQPTIEEENLIVSAAGAVINDNDLSEYIEMVSEEYNHLPGGARESEEEEEVPVVVPKKRGKKPKVAPAAAEADDSASVATTETKAPKKRGRKPKVAAAEETATADTEAVADDTASIATTSTTATKKRGRKPKAAAAEEEEDAVIEEKEPCEVCLSPFTAVLRKPVPCPSCQKEVCKQCLKQYILSTTDDPHCLHCKHGYDRMFLQTNLSKLYMNTTYAAHRAQVLWRREESFLPATQIKAERVRRGHKYWEQVIKPIETYRTTLYKQVQELQTQIQQVAGEIQWHYQDRQRLLNGEPTRAEAGLAGRPGAEEEAKQRRTFTRKCTQEGCHGWLSSAWKCGLCDNYTCPDCYAIKGKDRDADTHTCNKDDLETAKLIRESSKPCPKCGEAIEKREGCDMMFCTTCHTPFSWKTLQIITRGSIHNPHYFEWRNRVGAGAAGGAHAAEPLPCGGMPTDNFIFKKAGQPANYVLTAATREAIGRRFRVTSHIENVVAPDYANHTEVQNTERYRIQYLLNEMTKEQIESILQKQETTRERHKAIRDVLDTYLVAAAEQFRIVAENTTEEVALATITNLDQLRDFINETLRNVHKYYGCTVPVIMNNWDNTESYTAASERKKLRMEALENADTELVGWKAELEERTRTINMKRAELNAFTRGRNYYDYYRDTAYRALYDDVYRSETDLYTLRNKIAVRRDKIAEGSVATTAVAAIATAAANTPQSQNLAQAAELAQTAKSADDWQAVTNLLTGNTNP